MTVGELCGEEFERLAEDVLEALAISDRTEGRRGLSYLLTLLALQAGISYKGWYGSPWWQDVVERFIELIDDPSSSAWKYATPREAEPDAVSDHDKLTQVLLETPESLDDDSIYWCLAHGLGGQATFSGFARWRKQRNPDWVDPSSWLSER